MSGCLCLFGILKIFDEILLLHCFLIETPPLSGKILITTALHNSIHCFDTTLVRCAKAIPKLESKYNTLSLCLLLWLLAPSLWLLIYCVPFSYWVLPSFTQCVLFLTQRINTPSLLSLLSAPRQKVGKFSSPCHAILSHLSKTGVCIMLYIFHNITISQDAIVCAPCSCMVPNAVGEPHTEGRTGMLKSSEEYGENQTMQA